MMKHVYSVGQVNKYIKNMFAQDFMLRLRSHHKMHEYVACDAVVYH